MASRCGSPNLTADVGKNKWVGVSPPLPRVIARQADRTGSDNEGIVFHGAVGRSENGGGSKRVWVWVFEEKRSGFPTRGWAVRRARNRQTKELIQTAADQPRRWTFDIWLRLGGGSPIVDRASRSFIFTPQPSKSTQAPRWQSPLHRRKTAGRSSDTGKENPSAG